MGWGTGDSSIKRVGALCRLIHYHTIYNENINPIAAAILSLLYLFTFNTDTIDGMGIRIMSTPGCFEESIQHLVGV